MSISKVAFDVLGAIQDESRLTRGNALKNLQISSDAIWFMMRASEKNAAGSVIMDQQVKFQTKVIEGTRDIQF